MWLVNVVKLVNYRLGLGIFYVYSEIWNLFVKNVNIFV